MAFHGLSQCQTAAALHDPFMPSKLVPPGWLLHITKSSYQHKVQPRLSLEHSFFVLSENTSQKISPQWCCPLLLFFFFKDLFIICKYTVAIFRHTRRGCQISLRVVVSHHVVAGIWTQDLRKSSQCSYPLSHLASPTLEFSKSILIRVFTHFNLPSSSPATRGSKKEKVNRAKPDVDLFRNSSLGNYNFHCQDISSSVHMNQQQQLNPLGWQAHPAGTKRLC